MGKHREKTKAEKLDAKLARKAAAHDSPLVRIGGKASELTDQPPLVALSLGTVAIGALRRDRSMMRAGARMLIAHAIATGAKAALKQSIDRTRPKVAGDDDRRSGKLKKGRRNEHDENAFPSGHTAGAVAVAQAVATDYPAAGPVAQGLAAAAAAIQVPRGKHYPGDVLAGTIIGLAAGPLADVIVEAGERAIEAAVGRVRKL